MIQGTHRIINYRLIDGPPKILVQFRNLSTDTVKISVILFRKMHADIRMVLEIADEQLCFFVFQIFIPVSAFPVVCYLACHADTAVKIHIKRTLHCLELLRRTPCCKRCFDTLLPAYLNCITGRPRDIIRCKACQSPVNIKEYRSNCAHGITVQHRQQIMII